jgi:hypothetical protein
MTELPKCEWPTDCKKLARYKVQFYVDDTGRFSRPMNFCAEHFASYQVEDKEFSNVGVAIG